MTFPLTERPLPPHPPLVKESPWEHFRPDKKLQPPDFTVQSDPCTATFSFGISMGSLTRCAGGRQGDSSCLKQVRGVFMVCSSIFLVSIGGRLLDSMLPPMHATPIVLPGVAVLFILFHVGRKKDLLAERQDRLFPWHMVKGSFSSSSKPEGWGWGKSLKATVHTHLFNRDPKCIPCSGVPCAPFA